MMLTYQAELESKIWSDFFLPILNHSSNAKSNRNFNITYNVSSIVTQFYQKFKHVFMKTKVEIHRAIIPLNRNLIG